MSEILRKNAFKEPCSFLPSETFDDYLSKLPESLLKHLSLQIRRDLPITQAQIDMMALHEKHYALNEHFMIGLSALTPVACIYLYIEGVRDPEQLATAIAGMAAFPLTVSTYYGKKRENTIYEKDKLITERDSVLNLLHAVQTNMRSRECY